jgi:hypothetical protein
LRLEGPMAKKSGTNNTTYGKKMRNKLKEREKKRVGKKRMARKRAAKKK